MQYKMLEIYLKHKTLHFKGKNYSLWIKLVDGAMRYIFTTSRLYGPSFVAKGFESEALALDFLRVCIESSQKTKAILGL